MSNHKWIEDELNIIRRDYRHTHESLLAIANHLNVSIYAVKGQISLMGLGRSADRRHWTEKEEKKLRQLIPRMCSLTIARKMHRSVNSVVVKSKRLGMSRRCHEGWYTEREVCEILGHEHRWIQRRIESGALRASSHYETPTTKEGFSAWHIEEEDLRDFIRTYPEELNGCNLDIIMIVDILAGIKAKE